MAPLHGRDHRARPVGPACDGLHRPVPGHRQGGHGHHRSLARRHHDSRSQVRKPDQQRRQLRTAQADHAADLSEPRRKGRGGTRRRRRHVVKPTRPEREAHRHLCADLGGRHLPRRGHPARRLPRGDASGPIRALRRRRRRERASAAGGEAGRSGDHEPAHRHRAGHSAWLSQRDPADGGDLQPDRGIAGDAVQGTARRAAHGPALSP